MPTILSTNRWFGFQIEPNRASYVLRMNKVIETLKNNKTRTLTHIIVLLIGPRGFETKTDF